MGYSEKFDIVKESIVTQCKNVIANNWRMMFDMWLMYDAEMKFGFIYKSAFEGEFQKYMTPEVESALWLSAKNIVYSVGALMTYNRAANIHDILEFVEEFIREQLEDFHTIMEMYEEGSECES